ncbi:MAG: ESX secretion-associated protein EspG [Pseudonocardia sp.]|uniref:ESX secretion-associated protein EspG n=1 Tax=Pseudonocardia sp. TaxID=60912 RepID=UPI001ACF2563|nr:ESX secretion-associated protein EspG [Pseudonocardia sp.]MBN9097118.1 ESX secretion-associated protein EspG [Pseudonocardia sp.]
MTRSVLTDVEFDALWQRLAPGPTPVALRLPSPGCAAPGWHDVRRAGWQALRARGLVSPSGPDPETVRLLRLLTGPGRRFELRASWPRAVRAVAAGGSDAGVLAVRQDATVTLEPCGSLTAAVLGVLPRAGPGPGTACTVPSAVLTAALSDPGPCLRIALTTRGVARPEAARLATMLAARPGQAQIVATEVDGNGVARRRGGVLAVLDGPDGRYLLTRTTGSGGWSTVAPVDRHRLHELLEEVA